MAKRRFTTRYDANGHHVVEGPWGGSKDFGTGYAASVRAGREAQALNEIDQGVERYKRRIGRRGGEGGNR